MYEELWYLGYRLKFKDKKEAETLFYAPSVNSGDPIPYLFVQRPGLVPIKHLVLLAPAYLLLVLQLISEHGSNC